MDAFYTFNAVQFGKSCCCLGVLKCRLIAEEWPHLFPWGGMCTLDLNGSGLCNSFHQSFSALLSPRNRKVSHLSCPPRTSKRRQVTILAEDEMFDDSLRGEMRINETNNLFDDSLSSWPIYLYSWSPREGTRFLEHWVDAWICITNSTFSPKSSSNSCMPLQKCGRKYPRGENGK